MNLLQAEIQLALQGCGLICIEYEDQVYIRACKRVPGF